MRTCTWTYIDNKKVQRYAEGYFFNPTRYTTECGKKWGYSINPSPNGIVFCPFCGGVVKEKEE